LSEEDAQYICQYHLQNTASITTSQAKQILQHPQTLHLFATNEPKDNFNTTCFIRINNQDNPVAVIKPFYTTTAKKCGKPRADHFKKDNQIPPTTFICRGAKVEITGRNILPEVDLYNSVMGIVIDIVYDIEKSPNAGHLPKYILVKVPSYKGLPFLHHDPTVIPIVPLTRTHPFHCCNQTFVPLKLCFAKTIHTFQGSNAGPVAIGQPQNPVQKLVIDIGTHQFEGNNPGLSHTALAELHNLVTQKTL
jgi:hypothetical protein